MSNNLSRAAVFVVLAILMLLPGACADPHAHEKAAIRQMMRDYRQGWVDSSGAQVVTHLTPESLEHFTQVVRLALDGKEAEVRKATAATRMHVYMLRTGAARKDIRGKSGAEFLKWVCEEGWYGSGDDDVDKWTRGMADLAIDSGGHSAWCYILEDGERTRFMLRFQKVGERWLFDATSTDPYFDHRTKDIASRMGMSQDALLIAAVENQFGKKADPARLYRPMR